MRSYQVIDWGKPLEERERPTPEPKGTEVIMRVDACGVCHSDLHIWEGYLNLGNDERLMFSERGLTPPFTMGHEVVGEVESIGPEVQGITVGEKRIVYPWIGCGTCKACTRDENMICVKPQYIGVFRGGGYSDYVIVPHPKYLVDYAGIPTELACTYACSGLTAYSALKKTEVKTESDAIVIIGAGGLGLSALKIAPNVAKGKVIVADIDSNKLNVAREAGAEETVDNSDSSAIEHIKEITGGGAAAAIDFVGMPSTAQFGIDSIRNGGTLVSAGIMGGALSLPLVLVMQRLLKIKGTKMGTLTEMFELIELVKAGKVPPFPIETRPLDHANEALTDLRKGQISGRVVLKP